MNDDQQTLQQLRNEFFTLRETCAKERAALLNELAAARREAQGERNAHDLTCYRVRDLLAVRAYNEAAALCLKELQR